MMKDEGKTAASSAGDRYGCEQRCGGIDILWFTGHICRMRMDAIEAALDMTPFVPFRLVLPSDRSVSVPHPEFISISPDRRLVLVWHQKGGWSLVDPTLIVEIEFNGAKKR